MWAGHTQAHTQAPLCIIKRLLNQAINTHTWVLILLCHHGDNCVSCQRAAGGPWLWRDGSEDLRRDKTKREHTMQHWQICSLSLLLFTLYAWTCTWNPRRREKAQQKWAYWPLYWSPVVNDYLFSNSFISISVVVGAVLTRQTVYHLFPALSHRNVRSMQRQVWLSGWHKQSYVFVSINMITDFLVSKHPGLLSIIPHLLTYPLQWLSSAAPLHSGLSSTSHSARIMLFVCVNNILKMSSSQSTSIQPGMTWTQCCFPVWS